MDLIGMTRGRLADYVAAQLGHFFPDGQQGLSALVARDLDETLDRLAVCIDSVRMWRAGEFDYLHSSQYCTFIYYLSNTAWRNRQDKIFCTKLFMLNKTLNGFDCFYDNQLPDRFLIGHSVGIVLARNSYADYLVLYQNCTVGRHGPDVPALGEGVILYPNTAIIGKCQVGAHTVLSQGSALIGRDSPGDCYVFGSGSTAVIKPAQRRLCGDYFRL
jgi:serine O-acetyltransferase